MRAFLGAIACCWFMADAVMLAFPYGSVAPLAPHKETVVLCEPTAKSQGRIAAGLLIPKMVKTVSFVAADQSPLAQAQDTRRKKQKR